MGAPALPQLLTVDQVAAALAVDPVTVRRLVARGELVALRVGRVLRVRPEDLEAYLCRSRVHVPQPAGTSEGRTSSGAAAQGQPGESGTSTPRNTRVGSAYTRATAPRQSGGCAPPSRSPAPSSPWEALRQSLRSQGL